METVSTFLCTLGDDYVTAIERLRYFGARSLVSLLTLWKSAPLLSIHSFCHPHKAVLKPFETRLWYLTLRISYKVVKLCLHLQYCREFLTGWLNLK